MDKLLKPSEIKETSYPIQVEIIAIEVIGAAVESTIYESFSLEILNLSVKGHKVFPTSKVLA